MAGGGPSFLLTVTAAVLAVLIAFGYAPIQRELTVLGAFRTPSPPATPQALGLVKIQDTVHCEDLHHYRRANKLFTACEDDASTRFRWFPPLGNFKAVPGVGQRGSIHVVDPESMKSTRLEFENFNGRHFVTHGIDVVQDPQNPDTAVYIFAINHLPNPEYYDGGDNGKSGDVPNKARSQVELFHHVLDGTTVRHVRSIRHPLIATPNDIYAESPSSFYVTNDHFYREGAMRFLEDIIPAATWSDIIHVQIDQQLDGNEEGVVADADSSVHASHALSGLYNNNGLGHGRTDDEMLINSAAGGIFYRARPNKSNHTISILESVPLDSTLDNPTYYADPYAGAVGSDDDASGYVLAGLARAVDLPKTFPDPDATDGAMVWYIRPKPASAAADGTREWEKRLLFEDDGTFIRTATTAVLIPVPPQADGQSGMEEEKKKKKAWLFVTGFVSESIIAVPVDL